MAGLLSLLYGFFDHREDGNGLGVHTMKDKNLTSDRSHEIQRKIWMDMDGVGLL